MVSVEQKCPRLCSHLGTITTKIVQDGRLLCSSVLQGRNIACYNKPKLEFIKIEDCHWRRVTCNRINHLHEGPGLCRGWSGGQLEIFIFGICAVEVGYRASFPGTRGHLNELFTQRNLNELETHFISVPFRLDIEPAFLQHDTENKMNINDLTTKSRFVKWQSPQSPATWWCCCWSPPPPAAPPSSCPGSPRWTGGACGRSGGGWAQTLNTDNSQYPGTHTSSPGTEVRPQPAVWPGKATITITIPEGNLPACWNWEFLELQYK